MHVLLPQPIRWGRFLLLKSMPPADLHVEWRHVWFQDFLVQSRTENGWEQPRECWGDFRPWGWRDCETSWCWACDWQESTESISYQLSGAHRENCGGAEKIERSYISCQLSGTCCEELSLAGTLVGIVYKLFRMNTYARSCALGRYRSKPPISDFRSPEAHAMFFMNKSKSDFSARHGYVRPKCHICYIRTC